MFHLPTSEAPSGTPARLPNLLAQNFMRGNISSLFPGMLSPSFAHLMYSTFSKFAFTSATAVLVTTLLLLPPSNKIGVFFLPVQEPLGILPPIQITPPSSSLTGILAATYSAAIPPCPNPSRCTSRSLYPHFPTRPIRITASRTIVSVDLNPASISRAPVVWSKTTSSPHVKEGSSDPVMRAGTGVGPQREIMHVYGSCSWDARRVKGWRVSPKPCSRRRILVAGCDDGGAVMERETDGGKSALVGSRGAAIMMRANSLPCLKIVFVDRPTLLCFCLHM